MRRASTRDRTVDGSSVSCAAKVTGKLYSSTQSFSIGRAPEVPARTFAHMVSTSPPIGDVAPRPVITALRVISNASISCRSEERRVGKEGCYRIAPDRVENNVSIKKLDIYTVC